MNKINLNRLLNIILVIYILTWGYYAVFNWEVFSLKLNTNAGFTVLGGYPFAFFFLLGLVILVLVKYFIQIRQLEDEKRHREFRHEKTIMEKDIEILKMKEVLFKMQTSEINKNSSHLSELHEKLDQISEQLQAEREEIKKTGDDNSGEKEELEK